MRVMSAIVVLGMACAISGEAQAKRGGFKFGGSSGSRPASAAAITPASASAATAPARSGRGGFLVIPTGLGVRGSAVEAMPVPLRPAQSGDSDEASAPAAQVASAAAPVETAPSKPARPWCDDGTVVGAGAGFCMVKLAPGYADRPGFLALN